MKTTSMRLMKTACVLVCACLHGCGKPDSDTDNREAQTETSEYPVVFYDEATRMFGYKDAAGNVVIEPQFYFAFDTWNHGLARVVVDWSDAPVIEQEELGNFIRTDGSFLMDTLFMFPGHEASWLWTIDDQSKYFEYGYECIVTIPEKEVVCIDTNGVPLPLHSEYGNFVYRDRDDYQISSERLLVELKDGQHGVINLNTATFEFGPTNSFAAAADYDAYMQRVESRRKHNPVHPYKEAEQ